MCCHFEYGSYSYIDESPNQILRPSRVRHAVVKASVRASKYARSSWLLAYPLRALTPCQSSSRLVLVLFAMLKSVCYLKAPHIHLGRYFNVMSVYFNKPFPPA